MGCFITVNDYANNQTLYYGVVSFYANRLLPYLSTGRPARKRRNLRANFYVARGYVKRTSSLFVGYPRIIAYS
jgi:hypothetical protein